MWLDEYAVYSVEINASFAFSDGFEQAGKTEVSGFSKDSLTWSYDERECVFSECIMSKFCVIHLTEYEAFYLFWIEFQHHGWEGYASFEIIVYFKWKIV